MGAGPALRLTCQAASWITHRSSHRQANARTAQIRHRQCPGQAWVLHCVGLQLLIDQCHERGRYHRLDYRRDLDPPLAPDDARWVDDRLRGLGLS